MSDKNNNKKVDIKEILQDKQKRAILILTLYFVFFVFLTIFIRAGRDTNKPTTNDDLSSIINNTEAPEKIHLSSFEYEYKIMKDSALYTYVGKYYNGKEEFQFNNNTYFKENDKYYKKLSEEKTWEEVSNPYIYSEYLSFDKINEILSKSEYISTTSYKDKSTSISYKMYLNEVLTENVMTITSKENVVQKIEINLDKDSIVLEFKKQNAVEDFKKE